MASEYSVAASLGGGMPVQFRIGAAPCCSAAQFITQISSDNPWLILVAANDGFPISQPLAFGIFGVVPEAVVVTLIAAPVSAAHVVVENDHDVRASEGVDDCIHNVERVFAAELGIGFHRIVGNKRDCVQASRSPRAGARS